MIALLQRLLFIERILSVLKSLVYKKTAIDRLYSDHSLVSGDIAFSIGTASLTRRFSPRLKSRGHQMTIQYTYDQCGCVFHQFTPW